MLKKLEAKYMKQKERYWACGSMPAAKIGDKDERIRISLGTDSENDADDFVRLIVTACKQGPTSECWSELRASKLPSNTFAYFADLVGYKDSVPVAPKVEPTWTDLLANYTAHLNRPMTSGKRIGKSRAEGTKTRCQQAFAAFSRFLTEKGITNLAGITLKVAQESFHDWRVADIKSKSNSRRLTDENRLPGGYILDVSLLCSIFKFAVEQGLITKSPFRSLGAPGADPESGAAPYTKAELDALVRNAGVDLLLVLVMLRTGLRRSDAIKLQWKHIGASHVSLTAQKNGNKVRVPMSSDLSDALDATRAERYGRVDSEEYANDFVLLNPYDGKPFRDGKALYERIQQLGKRAGVKRATPHMFRDSFAKDCFLKQCSVAEVAAYLGDKPETVAAHYSEMDEERMEVADKKFVTEGGLLNSVDFNQMQQTRKSKVVFAIGVKQEQVA